MAGTSRWRRKDVQHDVDGERALSAKDETARVLALALQDEYWARVRAQKRTRVVGIHGTDFEKRDARIEDIVARSNARAVKVARKNALRAGWTKSQLDLFESDAERGSDNARA